MITRLEVSGWRCLKDVTLELTSLHALIGPNDSGKSTLLEALVRASQQAAPDAPGASFALRAELPYDREVWLRLAADQGGTAFVNGTFVPLPHPAVNELGTARRVRLDADRLRRPSGLLVGDAYSLGERGDQLPGVYDAILNRDRDAWDSIEAGVREGFPTVKRLALRSVNASEKVLEVELVDGTRVPADQMSEGLLYWLAFAALPYTNATRLLLVEEPENGLHPARIAEVVKVLRRVVQRGTQVVMATHSPLVVNELRPEEVSVVTRTADKGTRVRRVKDLPGLDRLLSAFSLGELWLAFADGKAEEGLFDPPLRREASVPLG